MMQTTGNLGFGRKVYRKKLLPRVHAFGKGTDRVRGLLPLLLLAGEKDDLLREIEDTFYGGGNAPRPTPTPTPVPGTRYLVAEKGTDSVPAMLTPGEAVLNVGAAEELGRGKIRKLNARHSKHSKTKQPKGLFPVMAQSGNEYVEPENLPGTDWWDRPSTVAGGGDYTPGWVEGGIPAPPGNVPPGEGLYPTPVNVPPPPGFDVGSNVPWPDEGGRPGGRYGGRGPRGSLGRFEPGGGYPEMPFGVAQGPNVTPNTGGIGGLGGSFFGGRSNPGMWLPGATYNLGAAGGNLGSMGGLIAVHAPQAMFGGLNILQAQRRGLLPNQAFSLARVRDIGGKVLPSPT